MCELIKIVDSTCIFRIINLAQVCQVKLVRIDKVALQMVDGDWIEVRNLDAAAVWQYFSERSLDLNLLNAEVLPLPVPSPAAMRAEEETDGTFRK